MSKWAQRSAWAKRAVRSKRTSERCERTSERTSKWPSTYVPILGFSNPSCVGELPNSRQTRKFLRWTRFSWRVICPSERSCCRNRERWTLECMMWGVKSTYQDCHRWKVYFSPPLFNHLLKNQFLWVLPFPEQFLYSHMLIRLKWLIQQGKVKGFVLFHFFFQLYDYQVGQCHEQGPYMHNCVKFEMIACFFAWFCLLDGVIFVFYIIFNCFSQSCNCLIFFISWAQNK